MGTAANSAETDARMGAASHGAGHSVRGFTACAAAAPTAAIAAGA